MRHMESKLRYGTASLSQLLYEDRPLLKPISFVKSKLTPTLFLKEEEIFKPVAEEAGQCTVSRHDRRFHSVDRLIIPRRTRGQPCSDC